MNISAASSGLVICVSILTLVPPALSKEKVVENSSTLIQKSALLCKESLSKCINEPNTGPITPLKAPIPGIYCRHKDGSCLGLITLDSIHGLLATFKISSSAAKKYSVLHKIYIPITDSNGVRSIISAVTPDKNLANFFNNRYNVKEYRYVVNKTNNTAFRGPEKNYSILIDFSPPFSSAK